MQYVHTTFGSANGTSALKVGLAILYLPRDRVADHVERLKSDLDLAKKMNVPVLIQVDTENWLSESLLNWYDPKKPGFDPAKVADVEWYSWTPDTAVKLCWRNWGTTVRGSHPNLLSPRFQAWEKSIYEAMAPIVVEWINLLSPDQRELFVGWKCGWETTPNSQYAYFKDGNSYYDRADDPKWDNANKQFIGYNAAKTSGIADHGAPGLRAPLRCLHEDHRQASRLSDIDGSCARPAAREALRSYHCAGRGSLQHGLPVQRPQQSLAIILRQTHDLHCATIPASCAASQKPALNSAPPGMASASSASARRITTPGIAGSQGTSPTIPTASLPHSTTTTR